MFYHLIVAFSGIILLLCSWVWVQRWAARKRCGALADEAVCVSGANCHGCARAEEAKIDGRSGHDGTAYFETSVVSQKSLDSPPGTVSGSTEVGLEPVGTTTKRFRQAPTVGKSTRRGWRGGLQGIGLLTTGGRPASVEQPNVKKRWGHHTSDYLRPRS